MRAIPKEALKERVKADWKESRMVVHLVEWMELAMVQAWAK
jgi:hypothetical protein